MLSYDEASRTMMESYGINFQHSGRSVRAAPLSNPGNGNCLHYVLFGDHVTEHDDAATDTPPDEIRQWVYHEVIRTQSETIIGRVPVKTRIQRTKRNKHGHRKRSGGNCFVWANETKKKRRELFRFGKNRNQRRIIQPDLLG